jgi:nucleoid-associated protein YgaU
MKKLLILSGCALVALMLSGCAPELGRTPLGEKEERWQGQIRQSYPSWRAPKTSAAAVEDNMGKDYVAPVAPPLTSTDLMAAPAAPAEDMAVAMVVEETVNGAPVVDAVVVEAEVPAVAAAAPAAADAAKVEIYEVKAGDTLSLIAKKVYKDGRKYNRIYEANKDVIKNPNALRPGTKLKIPAL